MVKEISLTQGKIALVDDDDFERVSKYKWRVWKGWTGGYYAITNVMKDGKRTTIKMHRYILKCRNGYVCDHINMDGLDNRKVNLRICDYSGNNSNKNKYNKSTSSKYKGVDYYNPKNYTPSKRWRSRIRKNSKLFCLGYFNTEKEAAKAYNNAAIKFHGEFACLNKI